MLVHFRLTTPAELTVRLREVLVEHDWVTNVTVQEGVCVKPPGDLVECDVAREKTGEVLEELEALGLPQVGGIVLTSPTGAPFVAAAELEAAAPGHPDDAVIWEAVTAKAEAGAVPTVSYLIFLVIAVALAAIAVVLDSAVLVVGAMVVGPEFAVIASACAGVVLSRWGLAWRSLKLLIYSFAFAVLVVTTVALLARGIGFIDAVDVTRPRPNTGFIWHPDPWSFIVALLAGAAGALALAVERSAIMVGVFISVTTVPAAGNLAVGLALWETGEIAGSLAQLGVNIACMLVAGTLVLFGVRRWWPWLTTHFERHFGTQSGVQPAGGAR